MIHSRRQVIASTLPQPVEATKQQPLMKIPFSAHPQVVLQAYSDLLNEEGRLRGISQRLDRNQAIRDEILAIRQQIASIQQQIRMQQVQIVKLHEGQMDIQQRTKHLKQFPLKMDIFSQNQVNYDLLKSQIDQSTQKVNALKQKMKQIQLANANLIEQIAKSKAECKIQRLAQIKTSFRMYYERLAEIQQQNEKLEQEIMILKDENMQMLNSQKAGSQDLGEVHTNIQV